MDLKETYNHIAELWHADHSDDGWWREGTDTFISLLPDQASVLDVGCGSGVKSGYLTEHGLNVTGIDIADKLLDIARREHPEISFEERSMYDLGDMEEKFNAVFAQASLLHIPKKDAPNIIRGMAERLEPKGLLYIAVKETKGGLPDEEIRTEDDYGFEYQRFFSYFTLAELEQYMLAAGLTVVKTFSNPVGRTVWLQIIGRKDGSDRR